VLLSHTGNLSMNHVCIAWRQKTETLFHTAQHTVKNLWCS